MIAWSFILLIAFLIFYLRLTDRISFNSQAIKKGISKRRTEKKIDFKLRGWKRMIIPPKKSYPFLPLIPFIILVYIFMNHWIFFAVITSDSMSPSFEKGDIVLMQSVDTDVEEDDIILFANKNPRGIHPPVIHRVIDITEGNITTKGDATNKIDDWTVKEEEVKAKALIGLRGKPIVVKDVGHYFIEDFTANGKYANEFVFTSVMVAYLQDLGIIIFFSCVFLYIILSIKDTMLH
jgi:signal peptidase